MFKSLAGVEPYLHGVGVAVNKDMLCWDDETDKRKKVFITVWDGMQFCNTGDCYSHACFPAAEEDEKIRVTDADYFGIKERIDIENKRASDESSFVRDGVKYVATKRGKCHLECAMTEECGASPLGFPCPPNDKDWGMMMWKRAEKQMRAMTAKEIYELAHQGAAFARFYDGHFKQLDFVKNAAYRPEWHRYCLLSEMTDDKPSTWAWRELKTECDA